MDLLKDALAAFGLLALVVIACLWMLLLWAKRITEEDEGRL